MFNFSQVPQFTLIDLLLCHPDLADADCLGYSGKLSNVRTSGGSGDSGSFWRKKQPKEQWMVIMINRRSTFIDRPQEESMVTFFCASRRCWDGGIMSTWKVNW